jgi:hypothetical protein
MYDLHIDEITYARFAQTIDAGELPRNFDGSAFFLHPPGYFAMLAAWRAIFWHGGTIFQQYTVLRGLNIFLAGLSAASVIGIARVVTGSKRTGYLAGLIFAIDPFIIRQNTRDLMETATMVWFLLGIWLLLRNINKPATSKRLWLGIGFVFGLAMVTKDVAIRKVGPAKRTFRYMIPAAVVPYGVWIAIVAISGNASAFLSQKTAGIRRFFGIVQTTGFNSAVGPSKSGTLLQTIPHYATSYGIMGLGAAASCLLLFSKDANRRRWGCIGSAATLLVGYLYVGGTFEEQYLYYLMVPSVISILVGFIELRNVLPATYHHILKVLAIIGVGVIMAFGIISYAINVPKTSIGWQTTVQWINKNVPDNSTICAYGQGDFLLGGHGYNVCDYSTLAELESNHVQYIIISEKLTYEGYEPLDPSAYAQVKKVSTVAFSTYSTDSGEFQVVKLDQLGTPAYQPHTPANYAAFPDHATTQVASSSSPLTTMTADSSPATLPNTGISLGSSLRVFIITMSFGMAIAYFSFYLKNRKIRNEQGSDTAFPDPTYVIRYEIPVAQYIGNLAACGEKQW